MRQPATLLAPSSFLASKHGGPLAKAAQPLFVGIPLLAPNHYTQRRLSILHNNTRGVYARLFSSPFPYTQWLSS